MPNLQNCCSDEEDKNFLSLNKVKLTKVSMNLHNWHTKTVTLFNVLVTSACKTIAILHTVNVCL